MDVPYSIEDLIIDDSFINYCKGTNEADIARWENYLLFYPHEKEKVEEARNFVTGATVMLRQKEQSDALLELKVSVAALQAKEAAVAGITPALSKTTWYKKYIPYAAAILVGAAIFFLKPDATNVPPVAEAVAAKKPNLQVMVFQTAYGEKKEVWLPDSSRVLLNAGSTLRVDSSFGQTARKVYLSGEALFDVAHNKAIPFSVHVKSFEVKVLGTLFNVKAYPKDKTQETSLLRGRVELLLTNGQEQSLILAPNQKVVVNNQERPLSGKAKLPDILPLTFNTKDSSVIETSWAYNRLDIYNKAFIDIQPDLERLYNVKVSFADDVVGNYRFSATFEKETIEQVLRALQLSYPFHYNIQNNQITISK